MFYIPVQGLPGNLDALLHKMCAFHTAKKKKKNPVMYRRFPTFQRSYYLDYSHMEQSSGKSKSAISSWSRCRCNILEMALIYRNNTYTQHNGANSILYEWIPIVMESRMFSTVTFPTRVPIYLNDFAGTWTQNQIFQSTVFPQEYFPILP